MPITPSIETFANLEPLLFVRPKLNAAIEAVNSALQPGDEATTLTSGDALVNYVLTANGDGSTSWQIPYSEFDGESINTLEKLNGWVTDVTLVGAEEDNTWTGVQTFEGGIKEVWNTLSGATPEITSGNWIWSITEDTAPTVTLNDGESAFVIIQPTTFSITGWTPDGTIIWFDGQEPVLSDSQETSFTIWNAGGSLFASFNASQDNVAKLDVEQTFIAQQTFAGGVKVVWNELSGSSVVVNGGNWKWDITEDSTASIDLEEGEAATIQVGPASTYGITWYGGIGSPSSPIEWMPGDPPNLSADGDSLILLWNKGGTIYGIETPQASGSSVVFIGSSPPTNPRTGDLWWDDSGGGLYMQYDDQWVSTSISPTIYTALRTFSGGIVVEGEVRETIIVANAGATYTIDLIKGTIFDLTLDAATSTITFPTPIAGRQFSVFCKQDATGGRAILWDSAVVRWAESTAPTLTADAGATDVFSFICDGTYWLGFVGGMNYLRS